MKTKIKLLAIASLVLLMGACKKDNNEKLTPTTVKDLRGTIVSNNPIDADSIYAITGNDEVVGRCILENGKFSVDLEDPTDNNLNLLIKTDIPKGVNISNKDVRGVYLEDFELIKNGEPFDKLVCGKEKIVIENAEANIVIGKITFLYVDRATQITGKTTLNENNEIAEMIFNLDLKNGWNILDLQTKVKKKNDKIDSKIEVVNLPAIPTDYDWKLESEIKDLLKQ